jgi:hypothetical protein
MMGTRIAAVTMMKDESDIVELFVKINARTVDHLLVLDHDSKDGPREVLLALRKTGYAVSVFHDASTDFQQARMVLSPAAVAAQQGYDFILPIDADEFIFCPHRPLGEALAGEIPDGNSGLIPRVTYVPTSDGYHSSAAPLHEVFRARVRETQPFSKIILRGEQVRQGAVIGEGNHAAALHQRILETVPVSAVLQHVPVRSADQIITKALLGSHRLLIKPNRGRMEAVHWDCMAQRIRESGYRLSAADLLQFACTYDADPRGIANTAVQEDGPRIGRPDDRIELVDIARINALKKFDELALALCREIRSARGMTATTRPAAAADGPAPGAPAPSGGAVEASPS